MAEIPVDLFNPGQVFACLGFLEAADMLLGDAEGGFDWRDETNVKFILRADGEQNPFEAILEFLAQAEPRRWGPVGYTDPPPKKGKKTDEEDNEDGEEEIEEGDQDDGLGDTKSEAVAPSIDLFEVFPAKEGDHMALPIRLGGGNRPMMDIGHWADGSSRESFKLYAGNRSADRIARAMLKGVRKKPTRKQRTAHQQGDLKAKGIGQLWEEQCDNLIERPLHVLTPMGGSFNFDPRGGWTAIDAGYSPNDQKHQVEASPVVEFLAAWGLENARPDEYDTRKVRYAAWGIPLPPALARAALCGCLSAVPLRRFRFQLEMSGKNKVVTFAELEMPS